MNEEKLYFAYGSNINLNQMDMRCPNARVIGPVVLEGYELLFRGNLRGCGVATIAPKEGEIVHGLLWNITPSCEQSLDGYEGFPYLYKKEQVLVQDKDGQKIPVMAYVMTDVWHSPALPSPSYYAGIQKGFWQNGLPLESLRQALKKVQQEVREHHPRKREPER
ncbi:gamma-glutamylcyclotransferase family protein [Clostridium fessum]|uniref:gamma-glutamylcyclotransferase family protein n=1 Tax=Clostridium fessum TaxID=2126740 RepID=UPI00399AAA4D